MTRARRPEDWAHDLATARPVEEAVRERLQAHPEVKRLVDATREVEGLDFEFKLDGELVRVDVKEKLSPLTPDYLDLWPGVPGDELFVLDETSLRSLAWDEGLGYLLVHDRSGRRWLVFGPWELLLAPHPRFERLGDRGSGSFLKGKLLLDMRTAAA
ncbi:MAG TPA: hypothetical protein VFP61_11685, partial [Acidimicrobiales bacterium]|nr:hypothetical protein [Acidimicrobiales bacterium]